MIGRRWRGAGDAAAMLPSCRPGHRWAWPGHMQLLDMCPPPHGWARGTAGAGSSLEGISQRAMHGAA